MWGNIRRKIKREGREMREGKGRGRGEMGERDADGENREEGSGKWENVRER